ncbi:hypothetical protein ROZALSC1DRAFT_26652 [Rozella allomycis CSF55]|uniref:TMC domain-containing protein n=1 Tax=Rozella allomycis (strain CSF55) TaxID=988480 RepID=A0A075B516_ROZAC|nr:TMC domain-containing protein [Rozella allomycis CSF55]RKP21967.1 hypothetical protein ROZALSC1DRAFT_26652 [Rozella allomycis CSF55]|eukprot:EPZ36648.1 TMC domain-containing protein [Rozella allomycis CSF55]
MINNEIVEATGDPEIDPSEQNENGVADLEIINDDDEPGVTNLEDIDETNAITEQSPDEFVNDMVDIAIVTEIDNSAFTTNLEDVSGSTENVDVIQILPTNNTTVEGQVNEGDLASSISDLSSRNRSTSKSLEFSKNPEAENNVEITALENTNETGQDENNDLILKNMIDLVESYIPDDTLGNKADNKNLLVDVPEVYKVEEKIKNVVNQPSALGKVDKYPSASDLPSLNEKNEIKTKYNTVIGNTTANSQEEKTPNVLKTEITANINSETNSFINTQVSKSNSEKSQVSNLTKKSSTDSISKGDTMKSENSLTRGRESIASTTTTGTFRKGLRHKRQMSKIQGSASPNISETNENDDKQANENAVQTNENLAKPNENVLKTNVAKLLLVDAQVQTATYEFLNQGETTPRAVPSLKKLGSAILDEEIGRSLLDLRKPKEFRSLHDLRSSKADLGSRKLTMNKKRKKPIENQRAGKGWLGLKILEMKKWWNRSENQKVKKNSYFFPIMTGSIRYIEGKFGSSIASYFALSRWIFMMNVLFSLIWLGSFFFPGSLQQDWSVFGQYKFGILNLVNGDEAYLYSIFFYGAYPTNTNYYNFQLAHIALILVFLGVSLLSIVTTVKSQYLSRTDSLEVDKARVFALTTFSSWDFSISSEQAKQNLHSAIGTKFKTLLGENEIQRKKQMLTIGDKIFRYFLRSLSNIFIILLYFTAAIVIAINIKADAKSKDSTADFTLPFIGNIPDSLFNIFQKIPPTLSISVLNIVMTTLFYYIGGFEEWDDPTFETNILIARSFVFKIASIGMIVFTLWGTIDGNKNGPKILPVDKCWENRFGQKFYQLAWTDFLVTFATTIAIPAIKYYIVVKKPGEFDIAANILELVYRQAIVWFGTPFCPILPFLSMVANLILFHVKKLSLVRFTAPPKRIYSSYKQSIYFMLFMLTTLIFMMLLLGFVLTTVITSCGPHKSVRLITDYINQVIATMPDTWNYIFSFIGTIGFLIPFILCLGLWVYYLLAIGYKRNEGIKWLQKELNTEREDKRHLLRLYSKNQDKIE